jgi:hypothetical protein
MKDYLLTPNSEPKGLGCVRNCVHVCKNPQGVMESMMFNSMALSNPLAPPWLTQGLCMTQAQYKHRLPTWVEAMGWRHGNMSSQVAVEINP